MSSSGLNRDGLQALAKAVEAVETAGMRNGTSNNASPSGIRSIFGDTGTLEITFFTPVLNYPLP